MGALDGVALTNLLGVVTAASVFVFHIREVEYRKVLVLAAAAVVAIAPGAYLARLLPEDLVTLVAGVLILAALALSSFGKRLPGIDRWPGQLGAGAVSGFMNVIAGVGGPAVTVYAVASRWDHARFAKSIQFYFMIVGTASFAARGSWPTLSWVELLAVTCSLVAGLVGGHFLAKVVPSAAARRVCITVAALGAVAVIVQALYAVVATA